MATALTSQEPDMVAVEDPPRAPHAPSAGGTAPPKFLKVSRQQLSSVGIVALSLTIGVLLWHLVTAINLNVLHQLRECARALEGFQRLHRACSDGYLLDPYWRIDAPDPD